MFQVCEVRPQEQAWLKNLISRIRIQRLKTSRDVRRPLVLACLLPFALGRTEASTVEFKITDVKGQPVADAVVSLAPLGAPSTPSTRNVTVEIEQRNQE